MPTREKTLRRIANGNVTIEELREEYRQNYWRKRDKYRAWNRAYLMKNRAKYSERNRIRRVEKKYGIDNMTYLKMHEDQKGLCALCGSKDNRGAKLSVDHCHTTKAVRKLLCRSCNLGLGSFKDSPEVLMKAAEYLWLHSNPQDVAETKEWEGTP